ncbi:MAG: hypothetical protein OXH47_01990 [Paracoccaceae bacterium]|nr:hypothetical protein [Paracoccaceae bacterium]MDE2738273.1 hypothetical protein [Paracoccaceae bacterium]
MSDTIFNDSAFAVGEKENENKNRITGKEKRLNEKENKPFLIPSCCNLARVIKKNP